MISVAAAMKFKLRIDAIIVKNIWIKLSLNGTIYMKLQMYYYI